MKNDIDRQLAFAEIKSLELSPVPEKLAEIIDPEDELFIEALVADPWEGLRERRADYKAAVDASNIVSFVDGLSAQQKSDVLDCMQFAERAANAKFDRGSNIELWYGAYLEVLGKLGWVTSGLAFDRKEHSEGKFKMSQEVIAIISAIATGNQLLVLKSALNALSNLADDSKQISLFDFSVSLEIGGNFQIGAAEANGDTSVAMAMGAFYYRSDDQRKNILFFSWGSHDVQMWTSAQQLTLDTTFYAPLRDTVRSRLGAKSEEFIANIPIV